MILLLRGVKVRLIFRCTRDVGIRFTFCIAQKVTKMLVALKTRLLIRSFIWLPGLLARLFLFHVLFLSSVVPDRVLSVHETGRTRCSDSLARQSLLIEMISLYDFVAHEAREFVFFFSGKKNQKPRRAKNSLIHSSIYLASWFAGTPICVSSSVSFICCAR